MVSCLALTAAPLDTAPRPEFAIAFVNAFCTELLAPALETALVLVPPTAAVLMPPLPLPPMAVVEVAPPPTVRKFEICAPVAAPPDVLT
jgi:hypothetical protein